MPEDTTQTETHSLSIRRWACLVHLSAVAGAYYPYLPLAGPLLIWVYKRQSNPYIDEQGRRAVNFHLTMCIYLVLTYLIVGALKLVLVGYLVFWIPGLLRLFQVLLGLVGALRAYDVEQFDYPFSVQFIKAPKISDTEE